VVTTDAVHRLPQAPSSALVLGGGPADTAFALEYAVLLAAAGSTVTLATPHARILPALDEAVAGFVAASLGDLGIVVFEGATLAAGDGSGVLVRHAGGEAAVDAEVIVAGDTRRPFFETLELDWAGVASGDAIIAGRGCETNVAGVYAAGDVTGGAMLTSAATHAGEVAGENASGGNARMISKPLPHLLHSAPEIGWIGMTEAEARAAGRSVATGLVELAYNARAMVLGGRQGLVKVVADRELGEVLGVHVVGPAASEILAVAATAIQAEIPVYDLAATVHWHPSMAEALAEAARKAVGY
jgi:dihydrolipoamide dehydrogenase